MIAIFIICILKPFARKIKAYGCCQKREKKGKGREGKENKKAHKGRPLVGE
jgi:hypothetical protein